MDVGVPQVNREVPAQHGFRYDLRPFQARPGPLEGAPPAKRTEVSDGFFFAAKATAEYPTVVVPA